MSNDPVKILKGTNGQLEVYSDKVIIKRKGLVSKLCHGLFKGDKTIYIHQITGIQVKPGGLLVSGYIQFTVPGGIESKKGLSDATQDENTVMFTNDKNKLVNEIKEYIEKAIANKFQSNNNSSVSPADELKKFKQLLDEKVISQEEFDKKKKELLGF